MSVNKIVDSLTRLSCCDLIATWHNALCRAGDDEKTAMKCDAELVRDAAEAEMASRELFVDDSEGLRVAQDGLLSALGYRVGGTNGQSEHIRRQILDRIVPMELPQVHSPDYMREWGVPSSAKRRAKLGRTLSSFIENARGRRGMQRALTQWKDDIDWVTWRHQQS